MNLNSLNASFVIALEEAQSQKSDLCVVIFKDATEVDFEGIFKKEGTVLYCPSQKLVDVFFRKIFSEKKFIEKFFLKKRFLTKNSFLVALNGYLVYPRRDKELMKELSARKSLIHIALVGHI